MKIITINNKHYISAKVVMLSHSNIDTKLTMYHDGTFNNCELSTNLDKLQYHTNQHLHLVCDLPIEEGDWCIIFSDKLPEKILIRQNIYGAIGSTIGSKDYLKTKCKKVIAATDSSLKYSKFSHFSQDLCKVAVYKDILLPQFQQSFIKEFVERQGKDVDVLVEVEKDSKQIVSEEIKYTKNGSEYKECEWEWNYRIKLNPDNTVNLIFK